MNAVYFKGVVSAKQYTAITLNNLVSGLTKVFLNEATSTQEPWECCLFNYMNKDGNIEKKLLLLFVNTALNFGLFYEFYRTYVDKYLGSKNCSCKPYSMDLFNEVNKILR